MCLSNSVNFSTELYGMEKPLGNMLIWRHIQYEEKQEVRFITVHNTWLLTTLVTLLYIALKQQQARIVFNLFIQGYSLNKLVHW